jgi:hypothetical protein
MQVSVNARFTLKSRRVITATAVVVASLAICGVSPSSADETNSGPIIIDNDADQQQDTTIEYQPLPTDAAGTHVAAGARFPIVLTSEVSSKTAKQGETIEARLKYDLKIGDRLVAEKGSLVRGHIRYAIKARTPLRCTVSTHRWTMTSGCLGITFDEIINQNNEHIPLVAEPSRQALVVNNKADGRVLGINHKGDIAAPYSMQAKYMAIRMGLNAAMAPAGVFTFGAMPAALGVIGAINPSFAFGKPVGTNVRHRRVKGFFWGALSGVPGSFLIEGTTVKGEEVIIKPGDEFLAEIRQEFEGRPATDAEMVARSQTSVHGEIVNVNGKPKL